MLKKLLLLFIFFTPFTSYFAISGWLRLPIVLSLITSLFFLVSFIQRKKIKFDFFFVEDIFLFFFLITVYISFLLGYLEIRSLNHTLAYTISILLFFFTTKLIISNTDVSIKDISKTACNSFYIVSLIIILDSLLKNIYDIELRSMFVEPDGKVANMNYYIRSGFYSVAGVAEEPGNMAFYLNIFFSFAAFYYKSINKNLILLIVILIICQLMMLSSSGIANAIIALFLISFFSIFKNPKLILSIFFFGLLSVIYITFFSNDRFKSNFNIIFNKVLFSESKHSSSQARINQWSRGLDNFFKHPIFGNGPGFGVNEDQEGYLSVYLTILSDIGIIGFLLFALFLTIIFLKAYKIPKDFSKIVLFGIITSYLHIFVISDFYQPSFWILLIFVQLVHQKYKNVHSN